MEQNNITNDFLKLCTDLRTTLHREVYDEYTIDNIYNEIHNVFGSKIIDFNINPPSQELTFSHIKEDGDNIKLSDFTIIIDEYILNKITENKYMLISLDPNLELVIDKMINGSLSITNLYNLLAITTDNSYDITIQL